MKISNETIGNRTCDLQACSAVPQPTGPRHYSYPEDNLAQLGTFIHSCASSDIGLRWTENVFSVDSSGNKVLIPVT